MKYLKTFESYENNLQDLLDTLQSEIFDEYDIQPRDVENFTRDYYSTQDDSVNPNPPYWLYTKDSLGDRIFLSGLSKEQCDKIDNDLRGELRTIIKDRTGLEYEVQSFKTIKYNITITIKTYDSEN